MCHQKRFSRLLSEMSSVLLGLIGAVIVVSPILAAETPNPAPPLEARYDVTIDDTQASFENWDGALKTVESSTAFGGSYRSISNWAGNANEGGLAAYRLPKLPAGTRKYEVFAWLPKEHSDQWHAFTVGFGRFQNIPWEGVEGVLQNVQVLGCDARNQGGWIPLGPGPMTEFNDHYVYLNGDDESQACIFVHNQPFYTADIAFDAIRVIEVPEAEHAAGVACAVLGILYLVSLRKKAADAGVCR